VRLGAPADPAAAALAEALDAVAGARASGPARSDAPDPSSPEFQRYFHGIAKAHEIIRKVFRIVDEQARAAGLEPLEHKVLIQIFGAPDAPLRVNEIAGRLDVAPALVSRLLKGLEADGLVVRTPAAEDRRITRVAATDEARALLAEIDIGVRHHVDYFQAGLGDEERAAALRIFAFYLGVRPPSG
jgi:DNA-binding MarR family transcriptional regulator